MTDAAGTPHRLGAILRGLAWDVGLPVIAYYALHLLGASDGTALLAATTAAALRIVLVAVRDRALNLFALVMLLVFGLGLALALLSGDPRFLLLKASAMTGAVGVVFLVTAARGRRPLTLAAEQGFDPERATQLAEEYRVDADVRRGHRVSSTVWGVGLLVEAAVRVPLIYLLPISATVGLSTALLVLTVGGLAWWNVRYVARRQRRARADPPTA